MTFLHLHWTTMDNPISEFKSKRGLERIVRGVPQHLDGLRCGLAQRSRRSARRWC